MFRHSVTRAERLGRLKSIESKASLRGTQVRSTATPIAEEGLTVEEDDDPIFSLTLS